MTDILCKWINHELHLSKVIDKSSFSEVFSSGYVLGEIFHKYNLQNDFDSFSQSSSATAKLNNFTRLEPTLALLQIPFNTNMAYSIMSEDKGVVTRLLYQVYVALNRLEKNKLTGVAIQAMRAKAPLQLEKHQSVMFTKRLRNMVPRETDLRLEEISTRFQQKTKEVERKAQEAKLLEALEKREMKEEIKRRAEERKAELELLRSKLLTSTIDVKRKSSQAKQNEVKKNSSKRNIAAMKTKKEIENFENNLKKLLSPTAVEKMSNSEEAYLYNMETSDVYMMRIKNRLEEDHAAREERAKRRRKILVDQMKAHLAQEESIRQEQVVQRLLRQSQHEKRITAQLMQARREKEVIKKNRIILEQQFEDRRLKEYHKSLEKEAETARLLKQEYYEELRKEIKVHENIIEMKRKEKYEKNFKFCQNVILSYLQLAFKISEYRKITNNNVPEKLMREWRRLTVENISLEKENNEEVNQDDEEEKTRVKVLNELDFNEYVNLLGEWKNENNFQVSYDNIVFGKMLYRLFNEYQPIVHREFKPLLPHYPVKATVIGKMYSGKSSIIRQLSENHKVVPICVEQLLQEAIQVYKSVDSENSLPSGDDVCENESLQKIMQLGSMASQCIEGGEVVADEVLVGLVVERISRITDGSGWVLDGFPTTAQQAQMLELAVSGRQLNADDGKPVNNIVVKKSVLVGNPDSEHQIPQLEPAIHVVILLDVNDQLVVRRATGKMKGEETSTDYHMEYNSPPFGSFTGVNTEKVLNLNKTSFDLQQIQERIQRFNENCASLKIFYNAASIVCEVNASSDDFEQIYKDVELALFETLETIQQKNHYVAIKALEEAKEAEEIARKKAEELTPSSTSFPETSIAEYQQDQKVDKPQKKGGKGGNLKGSGRKNSKGKKTSSSPQLNKTENANQEAVKPPPPRPIPSDPDYIFVEEAIQQNLYKPLVRIWDATESKYMSTLKDVFHKMRVEREEILRYLYNTRIQYSTFLKRSDRKQPFINSWLTDYNLFDKDVRGDVQTRDEMHHRVEDLVERLWDICDAKKDENEEERSTLMGVGWIEDHLCILTNLFIMLMQVEIDRFQNSVNILRDYYEAMNANVPFEIGAAGNFIRLPLYNLSADHVVDEFANVNSISNAELKNGEFDAYEAVESNSRTKIPFVEPGQVINHQLFDQKQKNANSVVSKDVKEVEEKMISETCLLACNLTSHLVQTFRTEKESLENKENEVNLAGLEKGKKSGKNAGKPSKKDKKRKKSESVEDTQPLFVDPVEEAKKLRRLKMKEEYYFGLKMEENRVKNRIQLIGEKARGMLSYLKGQADQTFELMDEWVGEYFNAEMSAIEQLSNTVRNYIENSQPIQHELRLDVDSYFTNSDVKVLPKPDQIIRPPPVESVLTNQITIEQLNELFDWFYEISPSGIISVSNFRQFFQSSQASYENQVLPECLQEITNNTLDEICRCMARDEQTVDIDWRKFLLACCDWPKANLADLLGLRESLLQLDVAGEGWILQEQFDKIDWWFSCEMERPLSPSDTTLSFPYNRNLNLKKFIFRLFADHDQTPPRLNYTNMLLYFVMDNNPITGFLNAISIVTGQIMPKVYVMQSHLDENSKKKKLETKLSNENVQMSFEVEQNVSQDTSSNEQTNGMMSNLSEQQLLEMVDNYKADKLKVEVTPHNLISPSELWAVLHYNSARLNDKHRFASYKTSVDPYSMDKIMSIYSELGSANGDKLQLQTILKHVVMQDAVLKSTRFMYKDLKELLAGNSSCYSPSPSNNLQA